VLYLFNKNALLEDFEVREGEGKGAPKTSKCLHPRKEFINKIRKFSIFTKSCLQNTNICDPSIHPSIHPSMIGEAGY
jgi:hypothetical protein